MTVQETIQAMKFYKQKLYNGIFNQFIKAFDVAIQALEEVEQYRALGTVEELKEAIGLYEKTKIVGAENIIIIRKDGSYEVDGIDILDAYEKQIPKKCEIYTALQPRIDFDNEVDVYECPNCGTHIGVADENNQFPYCWNCGQALKWSEEE